MAMPYQAAMQPLSLRVSAITPKSDALVEFLGLGLGLDCQAQELQASGGAAITGASFEATNGSGIEVWPEGQGMPQGLMLQIEVADASLVAEYARRQGLEPKGPFETSDLCLYTLLAPGGLALSIQSRKG